MCPCRDEFLAPTVRPASFQVFDSLDVREFRMRPRPAESKSLGIDVINLVRRATVVIFPRGSP